MNISMMTFTQARDTKPPFEVIYAGVRREVTYRSSTSSGGAGMGEFPATATLVLDNGMVFVWNEWNETGPQLSSTHADKQRGMAF